jgi:CRISPR-associated endoribonuclease Cas6
MHICIEMSGENNIILPIHYNHIVQAFIYKTIDKELADFLHNEGYGDDRKFRLFCFSNLSGKAKIESNRGNIIFEPPVFLEVASPDSKFCESFANKILKKAIRLKSNSLEIASIKVDRQDVIKEDITINTLSPITVYSTLKRPDDSKYTCYFQPGEDDFSRIADENLRKKYRAFTGMEPPDGKVSFTPLLQPRLHIVIYKGFVIKGYTGKLRLKGPRELLQMAVDAGLGSKNSQGFGCVKMV